MAGDSSTRPSEMRPLARSELLGMDNVPPGESIPVDRLSPPSARTFSMLDSGGPPSIVPARDGPGWTIETHGQISRGIAGQDFRVDAGGPGSRRTAAGRGAPSPATGFIPPWLGRGYHPIVAPLAKPGRSRKNGRTLEEHGKTVHIFDGDSRIPIYPNSFPERAICKIYVYVQPREGGFWDFQGQATGFMVGRRLLMTSGHVQPKGPFVAWKIKVVPALFSWYSLFGPSFFTYAQHYKAYGSDWGNDFMLLRLYDDLGSVTGWFGAIAYNDDWEGEDYFSMCGYPWDVGDGNIPFIETAISVEDDDDGDDIKLPNGKTYDTTQIETRADTASGQSGSPLYSWFEDGNVYAIGVNKGTEVDWVGWGNDLHEVASGGPGLVALVNWGRSNWD
jgi:trypsin-like peptidase